MPIPRKDIPTDCVLNPCFWPKIIGNASNARYKIPSRIAALWRDSVDLNENDKDHRTICQ